MNEKQIAFIICVNNATAYEECLFYLDRLRVPDGYDKDIVAIQEAPSMTCGYNAGMQSTEAKYKVYLHQDVLILNQNFILDVLNVFQTDNQIGMLGMIGSRNLGPDAIAVAAWDTGKVLHNLNPQFLAYEEPQEGDYTEVTALDGLLLVTQYDVWWREDIFDGWDFYDISQCMEFRRAGYKVVVPYQESPWCYHDNSYSKMLHYDRYRKRFIQEYAAMGDFRLKERHPDLLAYEQARETTRKQVAALIAAGAKSELRKLFSARENQGYLWLREYEVIVRIDAEEEQARERLRFWENGMDVEQLLRKLHCLKYLLKRIEYNADVIERNVSYIQENYSRYAVAEVCNRYIANADSILESVKKSL